MRQAATSADSVPKVTLRRFNSFFAALISAVLATLREFPDVGDI